MKGENMYNYTVNDDIELKLLRKNDAEKLFQLVNSCREYLRKWLPWVDATKSCEDTKVFIQNTIKQFASNDGFQVGIWYKNELAGVIGYNGMNRKSNSIKIGYWLGEKFIRKGIMTKVCKVFVDYAFTDLNVNQVEIRCAVDNHKSRAIPEKLGFTNKEVLNNSEWLYDHYVNHIIYVISKKDWEL
jgi:ribosomal-protein-serine acetyltransferase